MLAIIMKKATSKATGKSPTRTSSKTTGKKVISKNATHKGMGAAGNADLMKLFEHGLKDMYWVEKALTRSIPKMIRKATSKELKSALEDHLRVTERQVSKLERVFKAIDKTGRAKKCVGMEGILKEGEELMSEFGKPTVDSAIIVAAQKVEHYEMSSYISLISLAEVMDLVKEADILQEILNEEMEADKLLTTLSVSTVHQRTMEEV
jgi:ferritin-like metal-binding protein YciE